MYPHRRHGSVLILIIVGFAILATVTLVYFSAIQQQAAVQEDRNRETDLLAIQWYIRHAVGCVRTKPAIGTCPVANTQVEVRKPVSGNVLALPSTNFGSYTVGAFCVDADQVSIKYMKAGAWVDWFVLDVC